MWFYVAYYSMTSDYAPFEMHGLKYEIPEDMALLAL